MPAGPHIIYGTLQEALTVHFQSEYLHMDGIQIALELFSYKLSSSLMIQLCNGSLCLPNSFGTFIVYRWKRGIEYF